MSNSLRDKLLDLGFKASPKPEPKPARSPARAPVQRAGHVPAHGKPAQRAQPRAAAQSARSQHDIDLAKAYAIRAQKEKDERLAAERAQQEQARLRREAKAKLGELLNDATLNDPSADIARHFDYGGKIKRIHVTAEQLKALNAGELGVVQANGRYLLVTAQTLACAEAIFPAAVALRVDPGAPVSVAAYADPQYQIPDDLVW